MFDWICARLKEGAYAYDAIAHVKLLVAQLSLGIGQKALVWESAEIIRRLVQKCPVGHVRVLADGIDLKQFVDDFVAICFHGVDTAGILAWLVQEYGASVPSSVEKLCGFCADADHVRVSGGLFVRFVTEAPLVRYCASCLPFSYWLSLDLGSPCAFFEVFFSLSRLFASTLNRDVWHVSGFVETLIIWE